MNTILLFLLSLVGYFTAQYHQLGHLKLENSPLLQEENSSEPIEKITDQRRLTASGVTVWEEGVYSIQSTTSVFTLPSNTTTNNHQTVPVSLILPDNNVAVTWFSRHLQSSGGAPLVMMMRIFSPIGVPVTNEIEVTSQSQLSQVISLASMALMQDGFLVTWTSGFISILGFECYRQLFYFNGTKRGAAEIINSLGNNDYATFVRVAANQDYSEFLFAWTSNPSPVNQAALAANGSDIRMQRFSINPFQEIGNSQVANSHFPDDQLQAVPFYFTDGSSMVLWLDERNQPPTDEYDIYAHFFDQNGMSQLIGDYKINDEKVQGTAGERVADLGNDRALVFWRGNSLITSRSSIFYRIIVNGSPLLNPTIYEVNPTVDYDKYNPGVSIVLDQFVLIYWSSLSAGGSGTYNITAQLFFKNMTVISPMFILKSELAQDGIPYIAPRSDSGLLFLTWEEEESHNSLLSNGVVGQLFQLTITPTISPTQAPTHNPTHSPTHQPTGFPTILPTFTPTSSPTVYPPTPGLIFPISALASWWEKSQGAVIGVASGAACCLVTLLSYLCIRCCNHTNAKEASISQRHEERL